MATGFTFSIFAPPYAGLLPLHPDETFASRSQVMWGAALFWNMANGHGTEEIEVAVSRPPGVPLLVMLPPARLSRRLRLQVLEVVEEGRPQALLPHHPSPNPRELDFLLRAEPESLEGELIDFLTWRGFAFDQETLRIVRRMIELSAELKTLSAVARGVYLSRRALGRRFRERGLPVPSHWLQFCRLLRATLRLHNSASSLHEVARSFGYPDGFTLSNQMERLIGVRPSFARSRLGWEWLAEAWLMREWSQGSLELPLRGLSEGVSGEGAAA